MGKLNYLTTICCKIFLASLYYWFWIKLHLRSAMGNTYAMRAQALAGTQYIISIIYLEVNMMTIISNHKANIWFHCSWDFVIFHQMESRQSSYGGLICCLSGDYLLIALQTNHKMMHQWCHRHLHFILSCSFEKYIWLRLHYIIQIYNHSFVHSGTPSPAVLKPSKEES